MNLAIDLRSIPHLPAALCAQADPDLWHPRPGQSRQLSQALAVCAACPERAACLAHALEHGEDDGVWGGTTPAQRARLKRRRGGQRGTPPNPVGDHPPVRLELELSEDEARAAHRAYWSGRRDEATIRGEAAYQRHAKRRQRQRQAEARREAS